MPFDELAAFGVGTSPEGGATRWGALTERQRAWADSTSLKTLARAAARDPAPLVTFARRRTVAKVDSMGFVVRKWMLGREVVERQ